MVKKDIIVKCKSCSKEIKTNDEFCLGCGVRNKKPIDKKFHFVIIGVFVMAGVTAIIGASAINNFITTNSDEIKENIQSLESENNILIKEKNPKEYKSVLEAAKSYSDSFAMSKLKIYDMLIMHANFTEEEAQYAIDNVKIDWKENALRIATLYGNDWGLSKAELHEQLISTEGDKFTIEEAQYAMDNVKVDWKENALKKAEIYSEDLEISKAQLYDRLISKNGGAFTAEEAQYAVDNIDIDWNANALRKANLYRNRENMSKEKIYEQLKSEHGSKFTEQEAQYAVDNLK